MPLNEDLPLYEAYETTRLLAIEQAHASQAAQAAEAATAHVPENDASAHAAQAVAVQMSNIGDTEGSNAELEAQEASSISPCEYFYISERYAFTDPFT